MKIFEPVRNFWAAEVAMIPIHLASDNSWIVQGDDVSGMGFLLFLVLFDATGYPHT